MLRILYIARYHRADQARKIELMAGQPDLALWLIRPDYWQDEYGRARLPSNWSGRYQILSIPMIGRPNDPHRALYRTVTFAMRSIRPQIVHAEEEPDSLAALQIAFARKLFAPSARLILHTWQNINRPKSPLVKWVTKVSLGSADAVLGANREAVAVLGQMGYAGHASVLPPQGVDTRVFRPRDSAPSDDFTVVFVGRLAPEKGLDILIEAIRIIGRPVRLLLAGGGPHQGVLEAQAREVGLREQVQFVAPLPSEGLAELLAGANALVLPSRTTPVWKEQFGRVLIEAMACRVPVVGSDSGAIPEVIGDAGLIFPEGDAAALAACLRRLMGSFALCRELGDRGYERATAIYSQERIAEETADFYRLIMGWKGCPQPTYP